MRKCLFALVVVFCFCNVLKAEKIIPPPTPAFPVKDIASLCEDGECLKSSGRKKRLKKLSLGIVKRGHGLLRKLRSNKCCR